MSFIKDKDAVSVTENKGIPESTLKIAAMIFMIFDHIGGGIVKRYFQLHDIGFSFQKIKLYFESSDEGLYPALFYQLLRGIGRLAFPIFIFCLIEGFFHTRSRFKYALRLLIFAFISEIPYDLALKGGMFVKEYQNVYFTLFLGFCTICFIDLASGFLKRFLTDISAEKRDAITVLANVFITLLGASLAQFLNTDYSSSGILAIVFTYLLFLRKDFPDPKYRAHLGNCAILTCIMPNELPCFLSLLLVNKYNGKRGLSLKYTFYLIYPLHLLIIAFICKSMGI